MASKYLQHAVGKRKTAIARIFLKAGKGNIQINKRSLDEYYLRPVSKTVVTHALRLVGAMDQYDILINVCGGGLSGQAGAIRHAIARALAAMSPENRTILKRAGLLTRDARRKERKLPGQPAARKKFQFSKR